MVRQPIGGSRIDGRKPVQLASAQEPEKNRRQTPPTVRIWIPIFPRKEHNWNAPQPKKKLKSSRWKEPSGNSCRCNQFKVPSNRKSPRSTCKSFSANWLSARCQIATLAKQLEEQQRHRPLPPIENGQVKVYSLVYLAPREACANDPIVSGTQAIRIAVDERSNARIMYGKPDCSPRSMG